MSRKSLRNKSVSLIINCDDFGFCAQRDAGIMELILLRRVASVSVIINGNNIDNVCRFINKLRQDDPDIFNGLSIGLHFNLTEGIMMSGFVKGRLSQNGEFIGKVAFYGLTDDQIKSQNVIKKEFTAQLRAFIDKFEMKPSHIDGHNHVHMREPVANIVAGVMAQYGIHRVRLPYEKGINEDFSQFIKIFIKNAEKSRTIYASKNIIFPSFIGHTMLGNLDDKEIKRKCQELKKQKFPQFLELMCHPGYADVNNECRFTQSRDRERQLMQLQSDNFEQLLTSVGGLSNYNELSPYPFSAEHRILIYSKMCEGTGNWTTAHRLKVIFQFMCCQVFLRSIEDDINQDLQIWQLENFFRQFRITLILGVNLTRSAKIIYRATRSSQRICYRCPYMLIVAGTDANIYFNDQKAALQLPGPIEESLCLISLSEAMSKQTKEFLNKIKVQKDIFVVPQSSNLLCYGLEVAMPSKQLFKNHNQLKQSDRYIIFPTSFRKVKDVSHVFVQLNEIILKYNLRVILVGPIIDQEYYLSCEKQLNRIEYIGVVSRQVYFYLLKHAYVLINTSQSQGMSCSILQAFELGIPVVARSNQGNNELIIDGKNGYIYQTPTQFMHKMQQLIANQTKRAQLIRECRNIFEKKLSFTREMESYRNIFNDKYVKEVTFRTKDSNWLKIMNEKYIHPASAINMQLYQQIPAADHESILDLGCGTAVFGLMYAEKLQRLKIIYFSDVRFQILGNAFYNVMQSSVSSRFVEIVFILSDMLNEVDKPFWYDAIIANLPQTPFRLAHSRLDRNGGPDSLKYHRILLEEFHKRKDKQLVLLYSSMAWPAKYRQLLTQTQSKLTWQCPPIDHIILASDYDRMQPGLSQYILKHCEQQRAQVVIQGDVFRVPARIIIVEHI